MRRKRFSQLWRSTTRLAALLMAWPPRPAIVSSSANSVVAPRQSRSLYPGTYPRVGSWAPARFRIPLEQAEDALFVGFPTTRATRVSVTNPTSASPVPVMSAVIRSGRRHCPRPQALRAAGSPRHRKHQKPLEIPVAFRFQRPLKITQQLGDPRRPLPEPGHTTSHRISSCRPSPIRTTLGSAHRYQYLGGLLPVTPFSCHWSQISVPPVTAGKPYFIFGRGNANFLP